MSDGGYSCTTPDQIAFHQLAARKAALKLEVKTGMRFSSRGSIYKVCKQAYGLKGNKAKVLEQMEALVAKHLNK